MVDAFDPMDDNDDDWLNNMTEAMVIVLALERGGTMRVSIDRVMKAIESSRKWYPNGMHAHWTRSDQDGYMVNLIDRSKCEKAAEESNDAGFDGLTVGGPRDDGYIKEVEALTPRELRNITHAQQVLLSVALDRLGTDMLEVTKADFDRAVHATLGGHSALSISKNGDRYVAARLTGDDLTGSIQ